LRGETFSQYDEADAAASLWLHSHTHTQPTESYMYDTYHSCKTLSPRFHRIYPEIDVSQCFAGLSERGWASHKTLWCQMAWSSLWRRGHGAVYSE
jgi:hypothetical protein